MRYRDQTAFYRRIIVLIINIIVNNNLSLKIIGILNKRFKLIKSVFVAYAATESYSLAYVFPKHRWRMMYKPWPVGLFKQNNQWGIMTVVSSTERDFVQKENIQNLKHIYYKAHNIKELVRADFVTFAGILPGLFEKNHIGQCKKEASVTVNAVTQAEKVVRDKLGYESEVPIIILGGKGYIGARLVRNLHSREVYIIDVNNKEFFPHWLENKPAILINLINRKYLKPYLEKFWKELVLLNEAYPAPRYRELKILSRYQSKCFHIVGVKAWSYPPLPNEYEGGIPCCAAFDEKNLEVIIKEITINGKELEQKVKADKLRCNS